MIILRNKVVLRNIEIVWPETKRQVTLVYLVRQAA
jgi:hypothetical protein